jgi:hypothetical protein
MICALFLLVARSVILKAAVECGCCLQKGVKESGLVSKEGVAAAPQVLLLSSAFLLWQCQASMVMCSRAQVQTLTRGNLHTLCDDAILLLGNKEEQRTSVIVNL